MSRTITVTLPEGYEAASHLIVVVTPNPDASDEYAVTVIPTEATTVTEIGPGKGLNPLLLRAARAIRALVSGGAA